MVVESLTATSKGTEEIMPVFVTKMFLATQHISHCSKQIKGCVFRSRHIHFISLKMFFKLLEINFFKQTLLVFLYNPQKSLLQLFYAPGAGRNNKVKLSAETLS